MWQLSDLCSEYQKLTHHFSTHVSALKHYSLNFATDFPKAIIDFLGYMEHVENTPIEQADAGHLWQYYSYLKDKLISTAEEWVQKILFTPLDMFLNFLYGQGYCPYDPVP